MPAYELKETLWTDADFDQMGWHDSAIHALAFNPDDYEFILDMDYIFQWLHPEKEGGYFKFWVAPVTMVFANAFDVSFTIEPTYELVVCDLNRSESIPSPNGKFDQRTYDFECTEGVISLTATGFEMFVRRAPILTSSQRLDFPERGGLSFSREFITSAD